MAAAAGRKLIIRRDGTPIAALRSRTITLNGEPIDITSDDNDGAQTLLPEAGQVSFNISFSGVMKDSELISSHQALGAQAQFEDLEIEFPDGATLAGTFFFASLTITGEYNDAITVEGEFQSSGLATFTPAP